MTGSFVCGRVGQFHHYSISIYFILDKWSAFINITRVFIFNSDVSLVIRLIPLLSVALKARVSSVLPVQIP